MFARAKMAEPAGKILEGVFAITKPPSLSSAQVLRDLQHAFKHSKTFKPLLDATDEQNAQENHRPKRRRIDGDNAFKMGHGGTLDPMATGVLIVGIGRGTKSLQDFLYCTKTYETVVLFGKSTDTYDVAGKVVASASTAHVTQNMVESKLADFRGKIKQVPPIYSALKINGMKAYEYARSGKELPRELEAREMEVSECVLTDWYEAGKHSYRWPAQEATEEDKTAFRKLAQIGKASLDEQSNSSHNVSKDEHSALTSDSTSKKPVPDNAKTISMKKSPTREEKAALHVHTISDLSETVADAPAAKIRLTVSSGFYVRSFAHDLGIACKSYGTMSELARTRQADFTTSHGSGDLVQALDYDDIGKGEDVWGPKVTTILQDWLIKNPSSKQASDHRSKTTPRFNNVRQAQRGGRGDQSGYRKPIQKRRNSSSPE